MGVLIPVFFLLISGNKNIRTCSILHKIQREKKNLPRDISTIQSFSTTILEPGIGAANFSFCHIKKEMKNLFSSFPPTLHYYQTKTEKPKSYTKGQR
jgi:hypothetical protein